MTTPSSDASPRVSTRHALVAEMQARLSGHGWPRLTISLILIAAGGSAFLVSVASLWAGFVSMPWRYAAAAIGGYAVFVLLIRAWIAMQRRTFDPFDVPGVEKAAELGVDVGTDLAIETTARGVLRAGDAMVDAARHAISTPARTLAPPALEPVEAPRAVSTGSGAAKSGGGSFDLDDLGWLLLAAALAFSALIAILWVVYVAPVLLAEVALDAAAISTLYRRLRRQDVGHWAGAVLRHTWFPAMVVIIAMGVAGFALQKAVPGARSIGEVVSSLRR